jgi:hypothetical protein
VGTDELTPMVVNWGLSQVLSYLRHLERTEQARPLLDEDPERWELR